MCGKYFHSVFATARTNDWKSGDASMYGVTISVTARAEEPFDRIGTSLIDLANGLDDRAERIWTACFANQWSQMISGNVGVMSLANAYLDASGANYHWTEAAYPVMMTAPRPVRDDWFSASDRGYSKRERGETMPFVGVVVDVQFQAAARFMNNADAIA